MNSSIVNLHEVQDQLGLDDDTIKELYLVFVEDIKVERQNIEENLLSGNLERLEKSTHTVKGIAGNYHALKVYEHAVQCDMRFKQRDYENMDGNMSVLLGLIDEVIEQLYAYFQWEQTG
ncbi:MAG: hypothetical protein GX434_05255 [Peptococcaceae bacterium]|nr:hypothetical protein [Peptococcaceae bacterium]